MVDFEVLASDASYVLRLILGFFIVFVLFYNSVGFSKQKFFFRSLCLLTAVKLLLVCTYAIIHHNLKRLFQIFVSVLFFVLRRIFSF